MRTTRLLAASAAVIFGFGLLAGCPDNDDDPICGDGVIDANEECDTNTFFVEDSCENEGFFGGNLTCTSACTIATTSCHNCGDGIMDADEACDGTDFLGNTCMDEGFDDGELACNNDCTLDTDGCFDSACIATTLTSGDATATTDDVEYYYEEIVTANSMFYLFIVDLYDDGSGITTGAHTLGAGNEATVADCFYCVYLAECTDSACSDTTDLFYFPTAGTLNLDTLGSVGGTFAGDVDSVVFTEWDGTNDEPVTDGECLDVASHEFSFTPLGQANW